MSQKKVVLICFVVILFAAVSSKTFNLVSGENMVSGSPQIPYPVQPEEDKVPENIIQLNKYHRPKPPASGRPPRPVLHAGLPQRLAAYPIPRPGSDHELHLNVTWIPPFGTKAREYSLEVMSVTQTPDCDTPMCYEYNIPGNAVSYLVPSVTNPVSETCTIRPGCAYRVRLIAHPWDGHTAAHTLVQIDECVSGVCSCAHASRLPVPLVSATTVTVNGETVANVSWSLPFPQYPQRLPRHLDKAYYVVSIGKQMVSNAHLSPWFATTVSRQIHTNGSVFTGDIPRAAYIRIAARDDDNKVKSLDVRWLARVNLVDVRGCIGPAGNATAYDPVVAKKSHFGAYAAWASFGGLIVLAMVVILAVTMRVIKRAIKTVRGRGLADAHDSMSGPVWLSMQLRT